MQTESSREIEGFILLEDALSFPEVKELFNRQVTSNEQLYLFVKNNYSPRYSDNINLESSSILDFFNSYKGLFLSEIYVKLYTEDSKIYGFSFYIEEQVLKSHRVTFGTIYLGEGKVPNTMKEGILEDIAYVLNKTSYLSILTTNEDKSFALYKSICDVVKCGSYSEFNNYIIFRMGHCTFKNYRLLYDKETMTEKDWEELKTKILEEADDSNKQHN